MFGEACFGELCFGDFLQVIVINYKSAHGTTKVVAVIDYATGKVSIIDKQKYFARTKVTITKNINTSINTSNNNNGVEKPNN